MVATKRQAIALGVLSCLIVGFGIAVMVVFHFLFESIAEANRGLPVVPFFWAYGLPALLTGVLGIAAAVVRTDVVIGIYMGISIACLVTLTAWIVISGIALSIIVLSPEAQRQIARFIPLCLRAQGLCFCSSIRGLIGISAPKGISVRQCDDQVNAMEMLAQAAIALLVVSWVLVLAGSIVGGKACCCGKPAKSTGVVIAPGGSPAYEMGYRKSRHRVPYE